MKGDTRMSAQKTSPKERDAMTTEISPTAQKISPFLWFDDKAEEAVNFYVSVFKNSRIVSTTHYSDVPGPEGKVMSMVFELEGQQFMALNGGPGVFTFTGAISFFVKCETQEEVDHLWEKLSEGGEKQRCGWLKDKYGVVWQIIPTLLGKMLNDHDPARVRRVTSAMLKMDKIIMEDLRLAYENRLPDQT
jgi:predicted 3-demethylubiquinone-9 3-methyltransferase (glyoxalase superfamily)